MGLSARVSSRTYRFSVYSYKQRKMRSELCQFSGLKIFPGHGKTFVKADGKRVHLINGKSEVLYKNKKNPRKVTWTILYRRKNKKGTMTEIDAKKRKRRVVKQSRGAGSLSWAEVQAKKAQRPEIRKAQKEAAIEKAKAKKKEQAARKKAAGATAKKPQQKVNMGNKNVKAPKARVGGKR